jgi:putative SOS response-associated peptidase YedK
MCNLYSLTKGQQAIREFARAMRDSTGNLPPLPGIFPDTLAPVVRCAEHGERELFMMRWGMPCPPRYGTRPVTNIRNTGSPHWRRWLKPDNRCVMPATSFCEWTDSTPKVTHWFALGEDRPLFAFAGIWCEWTGVRRKEEGTHQLFGFLTCEANDEVQPIHAKAMPVILTTEAEMSTWLTAPLDEALRLQRPLPAGALQIVAKGERQDSGGGQLAA